jgi:hypothetical protein
VDVAAAVHATQGKDIAMLLEADTLCCAVVNPVIPPQVQVKARKQSVEQRGEQT